MELYIDTYGAYVHVKDEMFEIKTKKDKIEQKHYFAAHKISSIFLQKGMAISTDAIFLAIKNNVDIVILDYKGFPSARIWHGRLGSTTKIRKKQLEASLNETAVFWTKTWIKQKIQNQTELLKNLKKNRPAKNEYIQQKIDNIIELNKKVDNLKANKISDIDDQIRGLEGTAGRMYFETLSNLLPKQYLFNGRSKRPATDPFNAFLNYSYGILYSKTEKSLIIAGLDPYVGFLHRDDYNQKSLVFDYIEPYRTYADEIVFKLFSAKKINNKHTDEITNGFTLNSEGKSILVQSFTKFMEQDSIRYKGRNQTRTNAMQMDAHHFANSLIK